MTIGAPTKFTPERVERFLQAIRMGATFRLACSYAGISHETWSKWRDSKPDFVARVKEAEGSAVVGWLAKIEKAASDGQWQAAAWKLERRYPEDYGRRDRIDQTIEVSQRYPLNEIRQALGIDGLATVALPAGDDDLDAA